MVKEQLKQSARDIERRIETEIIEDDKVLVNAIRLRTSKNEVGHINESLKTKSIPTPKSLIKYHKELTSMGDFQTRLVIPSTKFSDTFAKVGYLGLKNTLEENEINYTKFTIVQASKVKEEWEVLNWKINEVTIASMDAVEMYPLIKLPLVKKSILYFTRNLPKIQQYTVTLCLKLIAFGMSSTLLKFE